jgi:hypothetical protein
VATVPDLSAAHAEIVKDLRMPAVQVVERLALEREERAADTVP